MASGLMTALPGGDNWPMRINLVTPFAEKDDAKKLGARWDAQRKCWYIVDVADLTPYMRWIPDLVAATSTESVAGGDAVPIATKKVATTSIKTTAVLVKPKKAVPHCGCNVKPWDDCEHTLTPS
jgi:hypothetical protein